ncbi:hypothetical protein Pst134EA_026817 [Puccinia striiformis f. sp. tritici]|uniref:hypothetical protein n=1 Tax=Puccinia striiformis f. sp. tritici TaxID=168172 RepID=UPI0020074881|nr:hypothetical protein Pst134EA_026817 [Puccinia striiformis f. sp. tritici]KAH9450107.1 hypothetical protein Pst134EA_026817 [Puccinia striiformis f. sp. tritici]
MYTNCDINWCAIGVSKIYYDSCCNTTEGEEAFVRSHTLEMKRILTLMLDVHRLDNYSPLLINIQRGLSTAQANTNYFDALTRYVENERYPEVPNFTYIILICFSVLHFIVLVVCFVNFIWPIFNYSSTERSKKFWLAKLIPIAVQGAGRFRPVPLILINSGILMALSQVVESMLSIIYIYLTYFSAQSVEFAERTSTRPWACAITQFQFYSCWFMAWTSLYTRIYARNPYIDRLGNHRRTACIMFHPLLLNIFFCIIPILVTVASGLMIHALVIDSKDLFKVWSSMNKVLENGSLDWDSLYNATTSVSASDEFRLSLDLKTTVLRGTIAGMDVAQSLRNNIARDRQESLLWTVVFIGTCSLYMFSYCMLLLLISSGIKRFKRPVQIGLISTRINNSNTNAAYDPDTHEERRIASSTESQINDYAEQTSMIKGFVYLAVHGAAMILAMLCTIGCRITLAIKARELNWHAEWRAIGSWLTLVSGTFAALAITFQCVRRPCPILRIKRCYSDPSRRSSFLRVLFREIDKLRTIQDFEIFIPFNPETTQANSGFSCPAPQDQAVRLESEDGRLTVSNPAIVPDKVAETHGLEVNH